jgi:peptidoglycan hydrolase CwlO-like protein
MRRMPWARIIKSVIVAAAFLFFFAGQVIPPGPTTSAQSTPAKADPAERAALEAQLAALEAQIDQYQGQISTYQKQGKSLSTEVAKLNAQIASLNLQIKSVDLTLSQLGGQITATQAKIGDLENNIDENQEVLGSLLQQMYENGSASLVEVLLQNPKLSDFFNDLNSYSLLQNNVHSTIDQITDLRDQLMGQKQELTEARSDAQTIKNFRLTQATKVSTTKQQQNQLLAATKGQETKYQALLTQTKQTAAQIRSRLFELLGGGSMSFQQAYDFAKFASGATGVRPALILAVLDRESALGKNVGQCDYHTAMHPTRDIPAFLQITAALGINPETTKVSCANADGAYGGAMGPAQFIPSTWVGYAPRVAAISGRATASPWNNADAFIASGLYLKDAGAVTNERVAAAKYYCGGNYNRYVCLSVYAQAVLDRAAKFQDDISIIGG